MIAELKRLAAWVRKNPFDMIVIVVVVGYFAWIFTHPPTAQRVQAQTDAAERYQREQQLEQQEKEKQADEDRLICHLEDVCKKYGDVRQQCATAGNFDNCINVKLGDDASYRDSCANDGELLYPPDKVPGYLRCFVLSLVK